jgi:DNA-directed RNA polymerase specialized sigma24 family protein
VKAQEPDSRLSKISTHWPDFEAAAGGAAPAQCRILERYAGAVHFYLIASTGDPHAAEELGQDFALRFVRGDFRRLSPERGRFRDFVKAVLRNLVADYFRARAKAPISLGDLDAIGDDGLAGEREFADRWRAELLDRAWEALEKWSAVADRPHFLVLRWRAENPDRSLEVGAGAVAPQLSAAAFRQTLHRAREKFIEFLTAEVAFSLGGDDTDAVSDELAALGLLEYCSVAG